MVTVTEDMRDQFAARVKMWGNAGRIFGGWDEFLQLVGIRAHRKKRLRKKKAKSFMGGVVFSDLSKFALSLIEEKLKNESKSSD